MATYTKLKSGDWGVRVDTPAIKPGDVVTVTKKSGEKKQETIKRVLWKGQGKAVCAIESRSSGAGRRGRSRGTWTGCSCGSVEEYEKDSDCWSCRHDR